MKKFSLIALLLGLITSYSQISAATPPPDNMYADYYPDAKKIVKKMHLGQKIGQMLAPSFSLLADEEQCASDFKNNVQANLIKNCGLDLIHELSLGSVFSDADYLPFNGQDGSLAAWQKLTALAKSQYNGPQNTQLLLGMPAIHGAQQIKGNVLFPHNIGLGATHNPKLVEEVAAWTAHDMQNGGFNWNFAPTVSMAYDYRWGRVYETFSSDPVVTEGLSKAYVTGNQAIHHEKIFGVLSTAKYFLGAGDTANGIDAGESYSKDLNSFWQRNIPGFSGAISGQTASIMTSYSNINYAPMHFGGSGDLINRLKKTSFDKGAMFGGFVITEYNGITYAQYVFNKSNPKPIHFAESLAKAINAGVDMIRFGTGDYQNPFAIDASKQYQNSSNQNITHVRRMVQDLEYAVRNGLLSEQRIDEAVTRILAVKLAMQDNKPLALPGSAQKTAIAAAEQSLVLLKNQRLTVGEVLPLSKKETKHVIFMGAYDDIGSQSGGWSGGWQGTIGNEFWKENSHAVSVMKGIKNVLGDDKEYITNLKELTDYKISEVYRPDNTVAVVVLAEVPYADFLGDVDNDNPLYRAGVLQKRHPSFTLPQPDKLQLSYSPQQAQLISRLRSQKIPVVTILFSGRPVTITQDNELAPLSNSDALIAAWLPGTAGGQAIANALFGDYRFQANCDVIGIKKYCSNTLPFAWPLSMNDVRERSPLLFGVGYGLKT